MSTAPNQKPLSAEEAEEQRWVGYVRGASGGHDLSEGVDGPPPSHPPMTAVRDERPPPPDPTLASDPGRPPMGRRFPTIPMLLGLGVMSLMGLLEAATAQQDARLDPIGGWLNSGPTEQYEVPNPPGEDWGLVFLLGFPCVVAVIAAVRERRGTRQWVAACVATLVFAAVAVGGGVVYQAQRPTVDCKANVSLMEIYENYDVVACPEGIERTYQERARPVAVRTAAIVNSIAAVSASVVILIALWQLANARRGRTTGDQADPVPSVEPGRPHTDEGRAGLVHADEPGDGTYRHGRRR